MVCDAVVGMEEFQGQQFDHTRCLARIDSQTFNGVLGGECDLAVLRFSIVSHFKRRAAIAMEPRLHALFLPKQLSAAVACRGHGQLQNVIAFGQRLG